MSENTPWTVEKVMRSILVYVTAQCTSTALVHKAQSFFNPIPSRCCHAIYYRGYKKYPYLGEKLLKPLYPKVVSRSLYWLVVHIRVFKMFIKG